MVRPKLIALTVVLIAPFLLAGMASAQGATPATTACTVKPRTDAELAALASTPAAVASPVAPMALPNGDPVNARTFAAIQTTLDQLLACHKAGDAYAELALYTDAYLTNVAFAPETVPIVAGTPNTDQATPAATPETAQDEVIALVDARQLADGSVAGVTLFGRSLYVFNFIEQAGLWRIDSSTPFASDESGVPAEPVQAAISAAAKELGTGSNTLKLIYSAAHEWPDSSLGCPQPGQMYAQAITPGWIVLISDKDTVLEYHTDGGQAVVLCRSFKGSGDRESRDWGLATEKR